MRRVLTASAILCGALAGPALAVPGGGGTHNATLDHFSCRRSSRANRRMISVQAVMRHRPGTQRMALRFDLLWRASGRGSTYTEQGGDLGQWRSPTRPPTLGRRPKDVWRVTQSVKSLAPQGAYQFRVDFKWTGRGGSTLSQTSLYSQRCRQG